MKSISKLNRKATAVFCQLLERLDNCAQAKVRRYLKIHNGSYLPLSMERLTRGIQTVWGDGTLYGLSHTYEQNGDLMRDPEITFLVVDYRTQPGDFNLIGVYPETYQLDRLGIYQKCIDIEDYHLVSYRPALMRDLTGFSNQWMQNILDQGFLDTVWVRKDALIIANQFNQ